MSDQKLSLAWDSYQNNICYGLSLLQQRGEFVDMTLAADGHYVKVHQMVMSLVSPFIKELIASAHCPHPVIFLNRVSYDTLQSILEYAYTGEVLVARDKLCNFLEACKELHIKGLEGDTIQTKGDGDLLHLMGARAGDDPPPRHEDKYQAPEVKTPVQIGVKRRKTDKVEVQENEIIDNTEYLNDDHFQMDDHALDDVEESVEVQTTELTDDTKQSSAMVYPKSGAALIQYSLSCQGNIQLILNRYIYCMRHTRKNNERMWRCVNYNPTGCNATAVTKDDMVIFRGRAHNHPFHDKQILKRVHNNNIYTAFKAVHQLSALNKKLTPLDKGKKNTADISATSTD